MPASQHVKSYDRARLLETVISVKETTRDGAIAKALDHARIARETHDQGHAREAIRQREFAQWLDSRIRENREQLARLRFQAPLRP